MGYYILFRVVAKVDFLGQFSRLKSSTYRPLSLYAPVTTNKNFKSRPERPNYSKCMNFSLSGLDLKFLFMVTGAYYESGLYCHEYK